MRGGYEEKSFRGPPPVLRSNHVGYGPIATELAHHDELT